jgi:hypothetical protein
MARELSSVVIGLGGSATNDGGIGESKIDIFISIFKFIAAKTFYRFHQRFGRFSGISLSQ